MNGNSEAKSHSGSAAPGLSRLEEALGHSFSDRRILERALTHSSATTSPLQSNERLEFLGDRVLGLAIAKMLLKRFPDEEEGALGYRFTALVRAESLARVADQIGLPQHIVLSAGERETGGQRKSGIIANTCEAVVAAIYLDGGSGAAETFIERHWRELVDESAVPPKDAKTQLQELAQARSLPLPEYRVVERTGPDHAPTFVIEAQLTGQAPTRASGPSKRAAEQAAAALMLTSLA